MKRPKRAMGAASCKGDGEQTESVLAFLGDEAWVAGERSDTGQGAGRWNSI